MIPFFLNFWFFNQPLISWICSIVSLLKFPWSFFQSIYFLFFVLYFLFFSHSMFLIFQLLILFEKLQSFSARSQKPVYLKASMQRVKAKVEIHNCVILELPECLHVKMCKVISSSSITISHSLLFPPPKALPSPPSFLPPPRGGHDNAKRAWVECNNFFEAVVISRGGVSDSCPAFFLLIATTSNKNF